MVVRNGVQGTLYINGAVSISKTAAIKKPVTFLNADLAIGKNYRDDGSYFSGKMDHLVIYPSLLTAAQVSALYNANK